MTEHRPGCTGLKIQGGFKILIYSVFTEYEINQNHLEVEGRKAKTKNEYSTTLPADSTSSVQLLVTAQAEAVQISPSRSKHIRLNLLPTSSGRAQVQSKHLVTKAEESLSSMWPSIIHFYLISETLPPLQSQYNGTLEAPNVTFIFCISVKTKVLIKFFVIWILELYATRNTCTKALYQCSQKDNHTWFFWYHTSQLLLSFKNYSLSFTIKYAEDTDFLFSSGIWLVSCIQHMYKSTTVTAILLLILSHGMVVIYLTSSSAKSWGFSFWQEVLFTVLFLSLRFCINSELIFLHW